MSRGLGATQQAILAHLTLHPGEHRVRTLAAAIGRTERATQLAVRRLASTATEGTATRGEPRVEIRSTGGGLHVRPFGSALPAVDGPPAPPDAGTFFARLEAAFEYGERGRWSMAYEAAQRAADVASARADANRPAPAARPDLLQPGRGDEAEPGAARDLPRRT